MKQSSCRKTGMHHSRPTAAVCCAAAAAPAVEAKRGRSTCQSALCSKLKSSPCCAPQATMAAKLTNKPPVSTVLTLSSKRGGTLKVSKPAPTAGKATASGKGMEDRPKPSNAMPTKSPALESWAPNVHRHRTAKSKPAKRPKACPPADSATLSTEMFAEAGSFSLASRAIVTSANVRPQPTRKNQQATRPIELGTKPAGAVAKGSAKNPPPMLVPAIIEIASITVACFCGGALSFSKVSFSKYSKYGR
mmetsp:Transcript_68161/g.137114  ORF Transcript_68161/g.137114 Transcript_68161/m.137114 type:complete len:248 (-) Transcript_68161:267-1010(-)